jgi:predicted dehydrogenase
VYDKGVTLSRSAEDVNQLRIGYRAGDMWAPHLLAKEALEAEAEHFIACVRHEASPICGGMDGLRVVEILEAACKSIDAHGAPIQLGRAPRARTCERVPDGPVPQPS